VPERSVVLARIGHLCLVGGILVPILFPYFWMLTSSLKTPLQNAADPPTLLFVPTAANYAKVLAQDDLVGVLANSVLVGGAATLLGLALGLPCAFGIARIGARSLGVIVLVARMLPGIAMLVPWYVMFVQLGLVGTYWALVLSHLSVTLPLVVWLSMGFFEDIPSELMDAAWVDGCSVLGAFWRIALPLARAGIGAAAVLALVNSWNNFLYSLVLGGSIRLAPVATYNLIRDFDPDWGALNAAAVITTWPVILLSLPFSRQLVRGLTAGSIKG